MFWPCTPPSSTFPAMPLKPSSTVKARILKVLLLISKQPISILGMVLQP